MNKCDCFEKISESIKKNLNAEHVHFRSFGYVEIGVTGTNKKGKTNRKCVYHRRNWDFCPLCGERLGD